MKSLGRLKELLRHRCDIQQGLDAEHRDVPGRFLWWEDYLSKINHRASSPRMIVLRQRQGIGCWRPLEIVNSLLLSFVAVSPHANVCRERHDDAQCSVGFRHPLPDVTVELQLHRSLHRSWH